MMFFCLIAKGMMDLVMSSEGVSESGSYGDFMSPTSGGPS